MLVGLFADAGGGTQLVPPVECARVDVELDGNTGLQQALRVLDDSVAEDFKLAYLNQRRREASNQMPDRGISPAGQ